MSFGLGHGRALDPGFGVVMVSSEELGALPDSIATDPTSGWVDPRGWFVDPEKPFEIEIGSGKGTFLIQQAGLEPGTNFLGIEWAGEFAAYGADRIRRKRESEGTHTNVRMMNHDATELLRWRFPEGIARVVHLYFSDPWPKKRHHKKRVVQHRVLYDIWRVLGEGGELRVVTDHDELWAWDEAHFDVWCGDKPGAARPSIPPLPPECGAFLDGRDRPAFERLGFDRPESAGEGELVGTNFERKFRREGRGFNAGVLRKLA
jgi:tRNA (guanine-N7-)-methyltransferase